MTMTPALPIIAIQLPDAFSLRLPAMTTMLARLMPAIPLQDASLRLSFVRIATLALWMVAIHPQDARIRQSPVTMIMHAPPITATRKRDVSLLR